MNLQRAHTLVLVLLLLSAAAVWLAAAPAASAPSAAEISARKDAVPLEVGEWRGTDVGIDDKTVQILETDDIAVLEYKRGGDEGEIVWYALVAGFGKRAAYHPPELCYIGSHYEVLERERISVVVGGVPQDVMRLVIGQDGLFFEAWYWFTANEKVTASYYKQQLMLLWDGLTGKGSSGTLVRVSTPMNRDKPQLSYERLLSFVEQFEAESV